MHARIGCAVIAAAFAVCGPAAAQKSLDFRSVSEAAVILYDAPTLRGKKLFVAPRGMPFEVVVAIEGWLKVRDRSGDMAWLERRFAAERRMVVSTGLVQVRERAEDSAPVVLAVAQDVVLELLDAGAGAATGWVRVRHRDGSGFVRAGQVWGL
jgi:SH3-like domain-containing protein